MTSTIAIAMDDTMRFSPSALTIRKGETVRFVATNGGKQMHEMVIGTNDALQACRADAQIACHEAR